MTQITPLFLGQMDIVRTPKEENVIVTQKIFPRARRGQPGRSASEANLLAAEVSDDDDDHDDDDVMKMMMMIKMMKMLKMMKMMMKMMKMKVIQ